MSQVEQMMAGLLSLGALGTGLLAILRPRRAAEAFGLPFTEAAYIPYLRAIGARNLALGLILAFLTARDDGKGLASAFLALALTALIDALLTRRRGRPRAFLAHAGGALVLAAFGAYLLGR